MNWITNMNKLVGPNKEPNVFKILADEATPASITLEELLLVATKYGKPRLSFHGSGWYCAIDMNTTTPGSDFKVASEFGIATPMQAVTQCLDRVAVVTKQNSLTFAVTGT